MTTHHTCPHTFEGAGSFMTAWGSPLVGCLLTSTAATTSAARLWESSWLALRSLGVVHTDVTIHDAPAVLHSLKQGPHAFLQRSSNSGSVIRLKNIDLLLGKVVFPPAAVLAPSGPSHPLPFTQSFADWSILGIAGTWLSSYHAVGSLRAWSQACLFSSVLPRPSLVPGIWKLSLYSLSFPKLLMDNPDHIAHLSVAWLKKPAHVKEKRIILTCGFSLWSAGCKAEAVVEGLVEESFYLTAARNRKKRLKEKGQEPCIDLKVRLHDLLRHS